ncbi:MAG TPA: hypothetical protein PLY45_00495 [bacterium]|mgnify:CR=1 FL=1|nr:hypothetical protein [bacterium]
MGEGVTRTVAKNFMCGDTASPLGVNDLSCLEKAAAYINNDVPNIFDSYECVTKEVMARGDASQRLAAIFVLCTGKPAAFIKK